MAIRHNKSVTHSSGGNGRDVREDTTTGRGGVLSTPVQRRIQRQGDMGGGGGGGLTVHTYEGADSTYV